MKYATYSGAVGYSGGQVILRHGMSADPHHPLVKERPDLFTDEAPLAELSLERHPAEFIGRVNPERYEEADGTVRDLELEDKIAQGRGTVEDVEQVVDNKGHAPASEPEVEREVSGRRLAKVERATARPGERRAVKSTPAKAKDDEDK